MRHRKSFNHLSRKAPHRKAMLANMASSLIMHKRITTTTAKAKALRTYIEPLITRSKDDTTHSRRVVFSYLQDKDAVSELFREVAGKVADRPGGYTRILKLGARLGDSAEMAVIELVDYNTNLLEESAKKPGRRRRRRGGGSAKQTQEPAAETATAETESADVQDAEVVEEEQKEAAPESSAEKQEGTSEDVKAEAPEETSAEEKKESPEAEAAGEETKAEEDSKKKEEGETEGENNEDKKES